MLVMVCCAPIGAQAQVTTELLREDFSNGYPNGWSDGQQWEFGGNGNAWYWTSEGMGGDNGSMVLALWDWGIGPLYTPKLDASIYDNASDEVVLEFDYWMENNQYHRDDGAVDYLVVKAKSSDGQADVITINTSDNYSYYNENYYYDDVFITTNEGDWGHVSVKIPRAAMGSDLQITFSSKYDVYTASDYAIDNVVITGTHYTTYSYSPLTLDFGEVAVGESSEIKTVTLKNDNDFDVPMSQYSIDGTGAFFFELISAPDFIPAHGEATVEVRFNAIQFGVHRAELTFYGEVDKEQVGRVALIGSGVSPAITLNGVNTLFLKRRTQLGATRDTFVVVTHGSSTGTLFISPNSFISGDYADQYSIIRIPTRGLLPGESDTVWVRHNPTIEGGRSATLNIVSNGGNGTQQVELRGTGILQRFTITPSRFDFDSTELLSKTCQVFTLSNPGSDTLRIQDIYFGSADPDFTFQSLDGTKMTIAPEHSREITICFEPRRMGYRQATLRILTDIPKTYEGTPRDTSDFYVDVMGVGVPFGQLTFSDYEVDSAIVGQEQCQTDTIWNIGDYSMTINSASITGVNAGEFELKDVTFPIHIPAGGFTTITMCATPAERGLRDAQIRIFATSNARLDTIQLPLAVYGQIVCAQPSLTSLFDGGMTMVHGMDSMMVTITNCGDIPATYTATLPSGTTEYQIIGSPVSSVVAPGATYDYWVRFTPTSRGAVTSDLTISAPSVSPMIIALNGTGAGVTASNNSFTIPETPVTQSNTFTVTITNEGNIDWTTGTPLVTGSAYSTTSTGLTLAPGASGDITFTFAPTAVGVNTGSVSFPNASPLEEPSLTINFNGVGSSSAVRVTEMNGFALEQNYPNPFVPSTTVRFTTPHAAAVTITLVSLTGEVVKTLTSANYPMGTHTVELNAMELAAGTYFYVLTSEGVQLTRQMTVIK